MNIFTFPPEKPFIDVLAAHVLRRYGHLGAELAQVRVLLPTRRATQAFRDACLRLTGGRSLLLPRIAPLGDLEEEMLAAAPWLEQALGEEEAAPRPIIPSVQRRLLLTRLVARQLAGAGKPEAAFVPQAARLAQELARLFDEVEREELSYAQLDRLAPEELATHWQRTLDFLRIISHHWPRILEERGVEEPVRRRNQQLRALAARWRETPPPYPVIAAGSTGSHAAVAGLMKVIACLRDGSVILPGLNCEMEQDAWEAVTPVHPQFGLKLLLQEFGISRREVQRIDEEEIPAACAPARVELLRASLLPAEQTAHWQRMPLDVETAMRGMGRVECDTQREEAQAVALMLREALETPGKTAALVTHDRTLARMVSAELARYGVRIDDSAGQPLLDTAPAAYLLLVLEMALSQAAPLPLLSLLKHPLCAAGFAPEICRGAARALELQLLRGLRVANGFSGMRHALAQKQEGEALSAGDAEQIAEALGLLDALETRGAAFVKSCRRGSLRFEELLEAHLRCAEALAETEGENGAERLWGGEAGHALAQAIAEIKAHAGALEMPVSPQHYAGLLREMLAPSVLRRAHGTHPRLHILSPLEARLQHYDRLILAGLNEGCWPPQPTTSPWMSRPMMQAFGLPVPEHATGRAAHDFFMLACAREVILTRAAKVEGAPTRPARWLRRLDVLLHGVRGEPYAWPPLPYRDWVEQLNAAPPLTPLREPRPVPPVEARPRLLSVTDIETLRRDPYAIYAKHVLGLKALEEIDREPGASELGQVVHRTLELFARRFPAALPPDVAAELRSCGREAFALFEDRPAVRAYWWPRFSAAAGWLAAMEESRRADAYRIVGEVRGELPLTAPGGDFTLVTRIDRLECHANNRVSLIDYKTGMLPNPKEVKSFERPQLLLEACVALEGEMKKLPKQRFAGVGSLQYWKIAGEKNELLALEEELGDVSTLIAQAKDWLLGLIAAYDDPAQPYLVLPDADEPRFNDYEHLERREEWEAAC